MSKIGIIVATEPERRPFIERFGPTEAYQELDIYDVIRWDFPPNRRIYLILSGYGEIAAAAATQHLIDVYGIEKVINYGVVGGLGEETELKTGTVGFTSSIIHYGFDLSDGGKYPVGRYPNQSELFLSPAVEAFPKVRTLGLPEFICASADRFVGGGGPKRKLREKFGATICEMEAAGIVLTCNRNRIPCTFIKAISDGINEGAEAFSENVEGASRSCVEVVDKLIR